MVKETMNIHKALCELKILDARISKAISDCQFVGIKKSAAQTIGDCTVDEFKKREKANYNSALDLLRRREAIKRAVVLSNATTKVLVGGKEYTVAEAIELKNHGLDGKRELCERLTAVIRNVESRVELSNIEAERKADAYVQSVFGNKDVKADEVNALRSGYLAGLTVEVVDSLPGGAKAVLKKLADEIHEFEVEVDAALSTSNALTNIEVEY